MKSFRRGQTLAYSGGAPIVKSIKSPCRDLQTDFLNLNLNADSSGGDFKNSQQQLQKIDLWSPVDDNAASVQVLRFLGYQRPTGLADWTVTPIVLHYFVDDDTLEVYEGQGKRKIKLLRRAKYLKKDADNSEKFYHWTDLNLGVDIHLQGLTFQITDCDRPTADFLISEGIELNPSPIAQLSSPSPLLHPFASQQSKSPKLKQFLEKDGQVLRFFCIVCSDKNGIGQKDDACCELLYYLADDTLEVREWFHPTDGDHICAKLKRQIVPKTLKNHEGFFLSTALELSPDEVMEWYQPTDFEIGQIVNIYGRNLYLTDCDEFTKRYYKELFGKTFSKLENLPPQTEKIISQYRLSDKGRSPLSIEIPKCNHAFSNENSANYKNVVKGNGDVLHFKAKMETPYEGNSDKEFILSFYTNDETVAIREVIPGPRPMSIKFLTRIKVPKLENSFYSGKHYTKQDFIPHTALEIFSHRFHLGDMLATTKEE